MAGHCSANCTRSSLPIIGLRAQHVLLQGVAELPTQNQFILDFFTVKGKSLDLYQEFW